MVQNILTIDVEEYFQVENFSSVISRETWDRHETRLSYQIDIILPLLLRHNVKATFFVLGWIAQRHKQKIRQIKDAGHEIASHGFEHRLIYEQTQDQFRDDIRRSKALLEDIIGLPISGYRAPSFSITLQSLWALQILKEEGYGYDSSLFPVYRDRGGIPRAKRHPHNVFKTPERLHEFPISTVRIFGNNVPFSGGGYFRLLPYGFIKSSLQRVNARGYPGIMYLHPWEFDIHQPRIQAGALNRFRHYVNIARTEKKLDKILEKFSFVTMGEAHKKLLRQMD